MVFEPGTVLGPGADRRARHRRRARVSARTRGCASACCRPVTSWWSRDRSRRGRSAIPTGRCCSRWWPTRVRTARSRRSARRRRRDDRTLADAVEQCDAVITSGGVSVGDFDYVSDALERIAADDPSGVSRVDWYQVAIKPAEAAVHRHAARHPCVRAPGQPGVVVRELRAVRAAGAADHDGARRSLPARGRRHHGGTDAPTPRRQAAPRPRRRATSSTAATR